MPVIRRMGFPVKRRHASEYAFGYSDLCGLVARVDLGRSTLSIYLHPPQLSLLSEDHPAASEAPALVLEVACTLQAV